MCLSGWCASPADEARRINLLDQSCHGLLIDRAREPPTLGTSGRATRLSLGGPAAGRSADVNRCCDRLLMERSTEAWELTEEQMRALLEAAAADEREGRIVHCATEQELREFLQGLRQDSA